MKLRGVVVFTALLLGSSHILASDGKLNGTWKTVYVERNGDNATQRLGYRGLSFTIGPSASSTSLLQLSRASYLFPTCYPLKVDTTKPRKTLSIADSAGTYSVDEDILVIHLTSDLPHTPDRERASVVLILRRASPAGPAKPSR